MGKPRRSRRRSSKRAILERNAEQAICQTAYQVVRGEIPSANEFEKTLSRWLIKFHNDVDTLRSSLLTMTVIARLKPEHRSSIAKAILKSANEFLHEKTAYRLSKIRTSLKKLNLK